MDRKEIFQAVVFVVAVIAIVVFLVYGTRAMDRHDEINQKPISTACKDNQVAVQTAAMTYHGATSEYPMSIEALVPEYLEQVPRCQLNGEYSLDTTSMPPLARCSIHGTVDAYSTQPDIDEKHSNDWYYSFLKIAMMAAVAAGGIGLVLLLRSRRLRRER